MSNIENNICSKCDGVGFERGYGNYIVCDHCKGTGREPSSHFVIAVLVYAAILLIVGGAALWLAS